MDDPLRARDGLPDRPSDRLERVQALEKLCPVELSDELEAALDGMTAENYDADLIADYLAALDKKAPMPPAKNAQESLTEFQDKLRALQPGPGAGDVSAKPAKRRSWLRYAGTIAATLALAFVLLIGAQAAGLDIFGAIARWTEETFGIRTETDPRVALVRDTFEANGISTELAPTKLPEGFVAQEVQTYANASYRLIVLPFLRNEKEFLIQIWKYSTPEKLSLQNYERSEEDGEEYVSHGNRYYIFSNLEQTVATWTDGSSLLMDFGGTISERDMKEIIDSIGG